MLVLLCLVVCVCKGMTEEFLVEALSRCGYSAGLRKGCYTHFKNQLDKYKVGDIEAVMLLSNAIHETGGFRDLEELGCTDGKGYHGRGYIQLTHDYNYGEASRYIFGDTRVLIERPWLVAKHEWLAWEVAFWYWEKKVRMDVERFEDRKDFKRTIEVININEKKDNRKAFKHRVGIFKKIMALYEEVSTQREPSLFSNKV
ncbi:MAG: chitinase [Amphiamblys sp. WSBS2006]|nr:MAG: chitinase [Amphiamblys sp. WSBS2006]